jgi:hypothetical protein
MHQRTTARRRRLAADEQCALSPLVTRGLRLRAYLILGCEHLPTLFLILRVPRILLAC